MLPMAARPLSRASRATAARARRVRCDELEQKIARLWNTSPPHNPAARQVTPSTMNIFESGSRCAAASAAVHGAAAALISPRTPPTRAPPRPHATCALLSHPCVCDKAEQRGCSWRRCERLLPRVAGSGQRTGGSCAFSRLQRAQMCANVPAPVGRQPTRRGTLL